MFKLKKLKKLIIIFGLLLVFASCQKKEVSFSKEMIEKLSVIDDRIPSNYTSLDLYVRINDTVIIQRTINDLFRYYKQNFTHDFKTFDFFLDEVLNNDFKINQKANQKALYLDGFTLNRQIEKEYGQIGFDDFLKKYSKNISSKHFELELNKSSIKQGEYLSITYLLYKNKYDIVKDCYLGIDYIIKREDVFK